MKTTLLKALLVVSMIVSCSGCVLKYSINPPVASSFKYDSGEKRPTVLQVVDQRADSKFFFGSGGLSGFDIQLENVKDPIEWLSQALQNEFASRGVPVQVVSREHKGEPNLVLSIQKYQIVNYRASGFSPWVAYHSFKGDLQSGEKHYPVRAYFLYGKVPMWSMSEIHEPCLTMPMTIMVKDVVSKINRYALHYSLRNATLEDIHGRLAEKKKAGATDAHLLVLELGGSNNPEAMKMLMDAINSDDLLVRACAVSSIGTLGADDKIEFLKQSYAQFNDIDKFMALKAMGDTGLPEAIEFLKNAKAAPENANELGIRHCVELYAE
jgi:hypothetical protein